MPLCLHCSLWRVGCVTGCWIHCNCYYHSKALSSLTTHQFTNGDICSILTPPEKPAPTPLTWFPGVSHKVSTIICLSQPGSLWPGRVRKQEDLSQLVSKGEAPSTGVMNKLRFLLSSSPQHSPTAPLVSQHHAEEEEEVPGGCDGQTLCVPRLGPEQLRGNSAPRQRLHHSEHYPTITNLTRHAGFSHQKPSLTDC